MGVIDVGSFALGQWVGPGESATTVVSAIHGEAVARIGGAALDFAAMRDFARNRGGAALREMGFHDRARMLKALALYLNERKEDLYRLSRHTGATLTDSKIDIDGGIATMQVFAAKGRREMPSRPFFSAAARL